MMKKIPLKEKLTLIWFFCSLKMGNHRVATTPKEKELLEVLTEVLEMSLRKLFFEREAMWIRINRS